MTVTIYHNPRCSKSRQVLEMIRATGVVPEVVEYLKTPPDRATLEPYERDNQTVPSCDPEAGCDWTCIVGAAGTFLSCPLHVVKVRTQTSTAFSPTRRCSERSTASSAFDANTHIR